MKKVKSDKYYVWYEPIEPNSRFYRGFVEIDGEKNYVVPGCLVPRKGHNPSLVLIKGKIYHVEGENSGQGETECWARYVDLGKKVKVR